MIGVGAFAARWQAMRAAALRTAEAYWRVSRPTPVAVGVVAAGLEPRAFTHLFDQWTDHDHAAEANIAVRDVLFILVPREFIMNAVFPFFNPRVN